MRFFIFLIWIYALFEQIDNIKSSKFVPYNKLGTTKSFLEESCSLSCYNQASRTIVVQTAKDNVTQINIKLQDDIMAIVYYSCNNDALASHPTNDHYHIFQKLCGNTMEECKKTDIRFSESWKSLRSGTRPNLLVNLTLPQSAKHIKIRTEKCGKDPMIFTFKVNNRPIDYRQDRNDFNYTNDNFFVNNLQKTPIVLEVAKFREEIIADITFNVTRLQSESCGQLNRKHCSHLCQGGLKSKFSRCTLEVDKRAVKIGMTSEACPTTGWNQNAPVEEVTDGVCAYFRRRKVELCQDECVDMPLCSYMCVARTADLKYTESGYRFHKNYPGKLGSGAWTWSSVPEKMVLVNECLEIPGLCASPGSCVDGVEGYKCLRNDYKNLTCLKGVKNRFIQCPYDMETFVNNDDTGFNNVIEMKDQFSQISKSELPRDYKVRKVLNTIKQTYVKFTNKINLGKEKKNTSREVVRNMQQLFRGLIFDLYTEADMSYRRTVNGIYTYARRIKKTEQEIDIPMSEQNNTKEKEFVKLKLHKADNSKNGGDLNFMLYNDIDMMGESNQFDERMKSIGLNSAHQTEVMRYKNSDMILVSFNETKNISLQFRLDKLNKVEAPNWLYSVEDDCGYLADDSWTWSVDGCRRVEKAGIDYCECDHLSNFAMLVSMKTINKNHLLAFQYLSIIGGIVNSLSLLLFIIFVLFINSRDKLRLDQLNIAISLLAGTLVFLFGGLTAEFHYVCKIAALFSQYLFLSAFVWMLILGINVVKMIASLNYQTEDWMVKYRIFFLIVGYGVSLVIVAISGGFFWDFYGNVSGSVCWIDHRSSALLTFIVPVGLIIALNLIGLFFIANTLIRNYIQTRKIKVNESNELLVFLQLLVSMGLTWLPSYFATIYLSAMYLLVLFFPLQGLMMFLCVVVINKENREKVSSYVLERYSSLISKSTTTSGTKSNSKSKSTSNSKSTEQNQSLLSDTEKETEGFVDTRKSSIPLVKISNEKTTNFSQPPEC